MIIHAVKMKYYVICRLFVTINYEILLCEELEGESQKKYTMIRILNQEVSYPFISFLTKQFNAEESQDFIEYFSEAGKFCIVFSYSDMPLLIEQLNKGVFRLIERLQIGKNLLEKILLLDMPFPILSEILSENTITISENLEIEFRYLLHNFETYESINFYDVEEKLGFVMESLFQKELLDESSDELKNFISQLKEKKYHSLLELYKEYEILSENLKTQILAGKLKPKQFKFRIWEGIKQMIKYLKPVLYVIVICLGLTYLIYLFFIKKIEKDVYKYAKIGNIILEEEDEKLEESRN